MAVTLYGPTGLSVAGHAQEELRVDFALVAIHHPQMEEGTVAKWGELKILKNVTGTPAQFMVVTRSGPTGLSALIHVDREPSVALVPVPIPYQRTVDRIVADRVNLRYCKGVTHAAVQFTAATRNGLIGLTVASPVGEENNTVIVSAQILGQHTEDVTVAALDHEQNCGHVTFGGVQFMVDTRSGLIGLSVLRLVV